MLLWFLVAGLLVLQVLGQNSNQTFNWKFQTNFLSNNLVSCFPLGIIVFPNLKNATAGNFSGTPPYYMMAFPEGGQPITTLIGVTNDSLSWTPTHPVGTKLILQLTDADGNTGGTPQSEFEIVSNTQPGSDSCLAPPPPNDFKISSNMTQDGKATLETCQPWRLNINGGNAPYTVVLDATNSPVLTNITVPPSDNAVVYINRADPGISLFASVVDVTGRWATGTQFVQTTGSTNVDCIGFGTVTTSQKELDEEDAARKAVQDAKRRKNIIIGVVVSLVILLLITGGVGALLYNRRKKERQLEATGQDLVPRQFTGAGSQGRVLSVGETTFSATTTPSPGKAAFSSDIHGLPYALEPFNFSETISTNPDSSGTMSSTSRYAAGASLHSRPSFANFPATSIRRSKGHEAAQDSMSESNNTLLTHSSIPSGATRPVWPARSGSLQANRLLAGENEVIYQHQDGGRVVRELPPPYIAPPDAQSSGATEAESNT